MEGQPDAEARPPSVTRVAAGTARAAADMGDLMEHLCRQLDELEESLTELLVHGYATREAANERMLTSQEAANCPRPLANTTRGLDLAARDKIQPGPP